jgi:STE24 endopeptidase
MRGSVPRFGVKPERVTVYAVLALVLVVIGLVASIWRPLAPPTPALTTDLDGFAPEVMAAVEAYRGPRYVASALSTTLSVLVPLLVALTPWGRRLVARVAGPATPSAWRAARVAFVVSVLTSLATFPMAAWSGIVNDGRYGFRTQPATGWLMDWLTVSAGTWVAVAVLVAVLMGAVRRWPRSWPFRLTLVGSVVAAVVVLLHPLLLQPVLLPSSPMPPSETRDEAEAVLEEQGAGDLPLHVGDASLRTTRVNAVVVGIGPTERVVLYDTLLDLPGEQIQSVLAHELAHREHRDLLRGVLLVPAFLLPALLLLRAVAFRPRGGRGVGARGPTDPRLVATVLAVVAVLELVGSPVANVASRRAEAAADHRALQVTGDPVAQIASSRAHTVRDLGPPRGPTWARLLHGTHPSVRDRIRAAVAQADPDELPSRSDLEEIEREIAHDAVIERLE